MIISSEFYRTEMKKGKNKIESRNCGTIIIYKKRRVFNRKGGKALSLEVGFCSSRGSYYHFFYKLFIFWIIILLNFFRNSLDTGLYINYDNIFLLSY